ncbi:MAG: hypothetical protein HC777_01405 [Hyphomonadaceae bacterium]|nr:hypothetical protein [Hyphomonadaceae bacterium]
MKNIMIAALAISAISAPAFAQTATVTVNGVVDAACTVGLASTETISVGTIPSSGPAVVALLNAFEGARPGRVVCNGMGTTLTASVTPFTGDRAAPDRASLAAGFTNVINFTVDLKSSTGGYVQFPASRTAVITADTTATAPAQQTVGLVNSTFEVDVNNAALLGNATTLIAGNYTSTITYVVAART